MDESIIQHKKSVSNRFEAGFHILLEGMQKAFDLHFHNPQPKFRQLCLWRINTDDDIRFHPLDTNFETDTGESQRRWI